jgi:hypothetical protein
LADAAGAGCAGSVCADAIAVAPNNEATTRAEIANLERMEFLLIRISDAGVKTGEPNMGSLARERTQKSGSCSGPRRGAGLLSVPRCFILENLIIDPNANDASHNSALPKASAGTFRLRADYHLQTYKGETWEDGNGARVGN